MSAWRNSTGAGDGGSDLKSAQMPASLKMLKAYTKASAGILRANFQRLPRPYKLTLALTYRCNFRCRTCLTWRRPPSPEMPLNEIEEFFRRQGYFSWVDFTGGEIALRDDLGEILQAAAGLCSRLVVLHFPTNGWLTEKIIRAVRAVKKRPGLRFVITVSLDGPPAVHDRLKGIEGSWERALETYVALRAEKGAEAYLGMTLQRENIVLTRETLEAVQEKIVEITPGDFHYNLAQNSFFYDNQDLNLSLGPSADEVLQRVTPSYQIFSSPRHFLERSYLKNCRKFIKDGLSPLPCQALSASCYIDPSWDVYPCTAYDYCLGNLRRLGFRLDRVWRDPRAVSLQREIIGGDCPQCWTPCEAYGTILGNLSRLRRGKKTGEAK